MGSSFHRHIQRLSTVDRRRCLLLCLSCCFLSSCTGGVRPSDTNDLDHLYKVASGDPEFSKGTSDSQDALRKLAASKDDRATDMLLNIATHDSALDLIGVGTRGLAIQALAARGDQRVGERLARMLQTFETFDTRMAVSDALQQVPCDEACIGGVLHYLERIYYREPNNESLDVMDLRKGEFHDGVAARIEKEDQDLYENLYKVLSRNERTTMLALMNDDGLGSGLPTHFSISVALNAKIGMACPMLLRSQQEMVTATSSAYRSYQDEIGKAISGLQCK